MRFYCLLSVLAMNKGPSWMYTTIRMLGIVTLILDTNSTHINKIIVHVSFWSGADYTVSTFDLCFLTSDLSLATSDLSLTTSYLSLATYDLCWCNLEAMADGKQRGKRFFFGHFSTRWLYAYLIHVCKCHYFSACQEWQWRNILFIIVK